MEHEHLQANHFSSPDGGKMEIASNLKFELVAKIGKLEFFDFIFNFQNLSIPSDFRIPDFRYSDQKLV